MSNIEKDLRALIDNNPSGTQDPKSNVEYDLLAIINKDETLLKDPKSNVESLLHELYYSGGGSSSFNGTIQEKINDVKITIRKEV